MLDAAHNEENLERVLRRDLQEEDAAIQQESSKIGQHGFCRLQERVMLCHEAAMSSQSQPQEDDVAPSNQLSSYWQQIKSLKL